MTFIEQWNSDDIWIDAHTSGSTGVPKAVKLLKADMLLSAQATCRFFGLDSCSRLANVLSHDYIAGKMMYVRREVCGGSLYEEQPSSLPLAEMDQDRWFDLTAVVPSQLSGLFRTRCRLGAVLVGGAPVSPEQERAMLEYTSRTSARFYMTYGMTETCSHIALRPAGSDRYIPLPGHTVGITAEGCLTVRNPLASWNSVETHDLIELLGDGSFRWLGRADNVINSGGIKLHPEQLERAIGTPDGGELFYIIGRPSVRFGSEAVLVVERGGRDEADLRRDLSRRIETLPRTHRPKGIIVISRIPRACNGKIRRVLPDDQI